MTLRAKHFIDIIPVDNRGRQLLHYIQEKPHVDVRDYGAKGDNSTDDTAAIQAALDASWEIKAPVLIPQGNYIVSDTLKVYPPNNIGPGDGMRIIGGTEGFTVIKWKGPSNKAPFRILGAFVTVEQLWIRNENGVGWLSAIEYDGSAANPGARSTSSTFRMLFIDGNNLAGDGIALGRSVFQADQLEIDRSYIVGFPKGAGINILDSNALDTTVVNTTINLCNIGIKMHTSTNCTVLGGEIDSCDVNFLHLGGSPLTVVNVRSENSKKIYYNGTGQYSAPFTLINYHQASDNSTRPVTTGAISSGSNTLTLSTPGFVYGDRLKIVGAGVAGGDIVDTRVIDMPSLTTVTIDKAASTTVTSASVVFDPSVNQVCTHEGSVGPQTHIGCLFQGNHYLHDVSNWGSQTWIGCYWVPDVYDPYGSVPNGVVAANLSNTVIGCYSNNGAHKMRTRFGTGSATALTANSTTPSVLDAPIYITNNSSPTTITNFLDGFDGQVLHVLVNDANTSFGGGGSNIKTSTGAAVAASQNSVYYFVRNSGTWWMTK